MRRSTDRLGCAVAGAGTRPALSTRPAPTRRRRFDRPVSRQGEDVEHAGRRRLSFRAGVEFGPGAAERDEDFRGDQEHGERGLQAELAPQQAQAQDHGHETDAESGDEVHGQGGEERHPQRPHGGDANPLGGLDDLTASVPVAPEGSQRRKPLNELEEPPGQRPEAAPLPRRAPVGLPPEVDHGHGDRDAPAPPRRPARASPAWRPRSTGPRAPRRPWPPGGDSGRSRCGAIAGRASAVSDSSPGRSPASQAGPRENTWRRSCPRSVATTESAVRRAQCSPRRVRTARAATASATAMSSGRTDANVA